MYDKGSPYRPIDLRMRDDLKVVEHVNRGESTIVVGDMLAMEFYRLNDQEYFLLESLDGQRSVHQIKEEFEEKFAPHQIRYNEIQQYLIDFYKKSLVSTLASDQGRHLHRLGRQKVIKRKTATLKNVLAARFRGINPDRLFRFLTPLAGWFFSKTMVCINIALIITAFAWVGSHFDEVAQRLPSMQEFFSSNNWLLLALVLAFLKVLHEFGHGIVFTKYGGRCHELGVMLLVFMPTLYVNTSDSWRIDNKWRRAAIAAAGVYVELFLAALATFGWWHSRPGVLQYAFLNIMFLGSVSAFMFNGNPLLKFDGYYLLTDLIEVPNLQQRSQQMVRNWFLNYGLGLREGDEHMLPAHTKRWLAFYLVASFLYRIIIVYMIAFVVVKLFRPAGLETLAKMFSFFTMSMILLAPALVLIKYFWTPGNLYRVERTRAQVTGCVTAAMLFVFFAIPFADHVVCDFVVHPKASQTVYVQHNAVLKEVHVVPRQQVKQGDKIATLRNIDIELEIAELEGKLRELESEQRLIRLARYHSTRGSERGRNLREERITTEQRLAQLNKIQGSMVLLAPRDGTVLPQWQHAPAKLESDELEAWNGSPLHTENVSSSLERGQPICKIGDLTEPEAHLMIDQSDIKFVEVGHSVELLLDSRASKPVASQVASISLADADEIVSNMAQQFGGSIETKQSSSTWNYAINNPRTARPEGAVFEAVAMLPKTNPPLEDGIRGVARIAIGDRTLAGRLHRFLQKTFHFDL